ncbi:hypothetical protein PYW08_013451 [Mythimna loreyi]|uniref:Uncharacterized protein n=1 Tax=Mythimna loreyi TaxID=667449 RepID=A0ACC2QFR0_9NEOP|nr:hypothetical protein PYW08_013451 [Mythimna loreyi]
MNSLVVFLSVVALVAGKPSGLEPVLTSYSAPILGAAYAAPTVYSAPLAIGASAVSSQSRLDIKSSPAVVSTSIEPIARTVISQPAVVAAPAIATAAIAPAAVSSQSRIDIKSTPAISSTVVSAPVAYSASPVAYGAAIGYNAPILAGAVAPALLKTAYAAPALLKTAYAAPAILKTAYAAPAFSAAIAGPAVPLDTPEVIAARAAHFEAKALAGAHLIKKRSATFLASPLVSTHLASPVISTYASAPVLSTVHAAPLAYSAPLALSTPLITKAYSVHPW